jgi:hypothetical protein
VALCRYLDRFESYETARDCIVSDAAPAEPDPLGPNRPIPITLPLGVTMTAIVERIELGESYQYWVNYMGKRTLDKRKFSTIISITSLYTLVCDSF